MTIKMEQPRHPDVAHHAISVGWIRVIDDAKIRGTAGDFGVKGIAGMHIGKNKGKRSEGKEDSANGTEGSEPGEKA